MITDYKPFAGPHLPVSSVGDADAKDGYLKLSRSPEILKDYRKQSVICSRVMSDDLTAAVEFFRSECQELHQNLSRATFAFQFVGQSLRLRKLPDRETSFTRCQSLLRVLGHRNLQPLADDIIENVKLARELFTRRNMFLRFRTVNYDWPAPFHIDPEVDVLGVNYTEDGTEFGPRDTFSLLPDGKRFSCNDLAQVRKLRSGDISILNMPHRTPHSHSHRSRVWVGIAGYKIAS